MKALIIEYHSTADGLTVEQLAGFFVGWPSPPSRETHLKLLKRSDLVELALDGRTGNVVGFITAITDGVLSAYLPLLEVLPEYQHKGIGSELIRRMLARLSDLYMVDLSCDANLEDFYKQFGLTKAPGMIRRNYEAQSGVSKAGRQNTDQD